MNAPELKKLLKANNLTQEKLAAILNVSRFMVNQWCTGKRKISDKRSIKIKTLFVKSYRLNRWHLSNFLALTNQNKEEFASFYGVPVSTVKKWLSGKVEIPLALQLLILLYPQKAGISFSSAIQLRQN